MVNFRLDLFHQVTSVLSHIRQSSQASEVANRPIDDDAARDLLEQLKDLHQNFLDYQFVVSAQIIKEIGDSVNSRQPVSLIGNLAHELNRTLQREMSAVALFGISGTELNFHSNAIAMFGDDVMEAFPEICFDVDEAGKCYSLRRPTACVFHLMRVMECGLQAIGKQLGMDDPKPNWEPILKKIDAEIKKKHEDREFKGQTDFLASISAHMHAVKVAWRNRVMHFGEKKTQEEAFTIFHATRGLMQALASGIKR